MRLQGIDDELDMVVEVHAQSLGTLVDVVAVDLGGKALVLEFFLDGRWRERVDAVGADHAAGHHEAGKLVAGQESFVEGGQLGNIRRVEMGLTAWAIAGSPCSRSQATISRGCSSGQRS